MAYRNVPAAGRGLSDAWRTVDQTASSVSHAVNLAVARGITQAVGESNRRVSGMLAVLADTFSRPLEDAGRRTEMHRQIGVLAQRSVLASYGQVVSRRRGEASRTAYRAGRNRLAGGVLRRALGRADFFEAHPDGLNFVNMSMLDREAAHWARLAFGAAPRGTGVHTRYEVTWGGLVVGALGIDMAPSGPVLMPRGFWVTPDGTPVAWGANPPGSDLFFPTRRPAFRPTAGIEARPFLDAGVRRVARELPAAYENYYRELWDEFKRTGEGPLASVTVRVVVPRPQTTGMRRGR